MYRFPKQWESADGYDTSVFKSPWWVIMATPILIGLEMRELIMFSCTAVDLIYFIFFRTSIRSHKKFVLFFLLTPKTQLLQMRCSPACHCLLSYCAHNPAHEFPCSELRKKYKLTYEMQRICMHMKQRNIAHVNSNKLKLKQNLHLWKVIYKSWVKLMKKHFPLFPQL